MGECVSSNFNNMTTGPTLVDLYFKDYLQE